MAPTLAAIDLPSELASREGDGIVVSLWWSRTTNACTVAVTDARSGQSFDVPVADDNPMDVFHHPFAYAAARGIEHGVGFRRASGADDPGDGDDGWAEAA
jgi:hypothetical protein